MAAFITKNLHSALYYTAYNYFILINIPQLVLSYFAAKKIYQVIIVKGVGVR